MNWLRKIWQSTDNSEYKRSYDDLICFQDIVLSASLYFHNDTVQENILNLLDMWFAMPKQFWIT